ncbi:MAG: DUF2059 domain-containing protein [Roseiarcus sp.]|jgi:hypothetical protein
MAAFLGRIAIIAAMAVAGGPVALAVDATTPDQFEQKLKTYDPETVAAALAYAKTFNVKDMFAKAAPQMTQNLSRQLKSQNPNLNEDQTREFIGAFMQSALVDNAEVFEQATILIVLDIFSKDELVALNQFYSSPVGAGVLRKMPVLLGRMPELSKVMQTYVLPRALEAARQHMRASGVEVKL